MFLLFWGDFGRLIWNPQKKRTTVIALRSFFLAKQCKFLVVMILLKKGCDEKLVFSVADYFWLSEGNAFIVKLKNIFEFECIYSKTKKYFWIWV